jgi:hypothetical protein
VEQGREESEKRVGVERNLVLIEEEDEVCYNVLVKHNRLCFRPLHLYYRTQPTLIRPTPIPGRRSSHSCS